MNKPFSEFIGKTIKDIEMTKGSLDIMFEDGSVGFINMSLSLDNECMSRIRDSILNDKTYMAGGLYPDESLYSHWHVQK